MKVFVLTALLLPAGLVLAGPPPTAKEPSTLRLHGKEIPDPYRWLEGAAAPEVAGSDAKLDARVSRWTDLQNAYTRGVLDSRAGRAALDARIRELRRTGWVGAPSVGGDRYFYRARRGAEPQATLFVRDGIDGKPRVLVDPVEVDGTGLTTIASFEPSRDGKLVTVGLFRAGDEKPVLHLIDAATGKWLPDRIPGRAERVSWLPDGRGFMYRRLADPKNPYSAQVRFHPVGGDPDRDPILLSQPTEGPRSTTWGPYGRASWDGKWFVAGHSTAAGMNDLWLIDLERWLKTGKVEKTVIVTGIKAQTFGNVHGGRLILHTTHGAPNGRIVVADLDKPGPEHWRPLVPESPKAVLHGWSMAKGTLVVPYQQDATDRFLLFSPDGEPKGELDLPGLGTATLFTEPDRTVAFLHFTGFDSPPTIHRVDLATGKRSTWARPEFPVDPGIVETRQIFYTSKDGTRVPMFLVHKRGLTLDGKRPTVLAGYGGFGVSLTPSFSATLFPWLEAGGVYAVANIRGGYEYGARWRKGGMLGNKQNVFDDFIGAAEWLVDRGYTSARRLGIWGGSNGGLLVTAAATQRPELFRAVAAENPLTDMLRYQHFLMAKFWVPEYGSSDDPAQFGFLRAYSPYHRVEDGVKYPAMLITGAENDARVHALHARKMAARLQAATASDPTEKPVLLRIERDAGHGLGASHEQGVRNAVDLWSFFFWQLTGEGE